MKTLAEIILENRQTIEKKLLSKFNLSTLDLAMYFDAPVKSINSDMKAIGAIKSKGLSINVRQLIESRNAQIDKAIKSGEDKQTILNQMGLFREPKDYLNPKNKDAEVLKYLQDAKIREVVSLMEVGFSYSDAIKQSGGLNRMGCAFILGAEKSGKLPSSRSAVDDDKEVVEFATQQAKEIFNQEVEKGNVRSKILTGDRFHTVNILTGVQANILREAASGYNFTSNNSVLKRKNKVSNKQSEKEALKLEIYRAWSSGESTQTELAEKYNLTRYTILNYCNYVKAKNIETLSKELPTVRRRNSNASVRERIAKMETEVLEAFKEVQTSYGISKITGYNTASIDTILKKHGIKSIKYENTSLNILERASESCENSMSLGINALFGYGPNTNVTKQGINEYSKIISDQRETQIGLNIKPDFRQYVNENNGVFTEFYLDKNEKAKEQYIKKYPNSEYAKNEKELALNVNEKSLEL